MFNSDISLFAANTRKICLQYGLHIVSCLISKIKSDLDIYTFLVVNRETNLLTEEDLGFTNKSCTSIQQTSSKKYLNSITLALPSSNFTIFKLLTSKSMSLNLNLRIFNLVLENLSKTPSKYSLT